MTAAAARRRVFVRGEGGDSEMYRHRHVFVQRL